jgi:hypothetical protein
MSSYTRSRRFRALAIYAVLVVLTACSTAIGPSRAELENKFKVSLPPAWTMTSFKVTAEENAGTQTQPDVRSRIAVMVVLARDLYEPREHILGKPVLVRTKAAGDVKFELHGIARSHQSAGSWKVDFNFENADNLNIEAPGKPLSDYSDYVLAGSPEESTLRNEVAKQAEAERMASAEAERVAQEKERALNQATGALFTPGTKFVSRWNETRTQRSGVHTFVVQKHDPVTRTFAGRFEYEGEAPTAVSGSYDGQKVNIAFDSRKCGFDLVATGGIPALRGTYSGPILGGCGQGGTIEIRLQ